MKKILFLLMCMTIVNISCQKKETINNVVKSTTDTLIEKPKLVYFDDDNIQDKIEILANPDNKILNFALSINLSSLNKTIEIPVLNNSILYNNDYSVYYLSDPIIKNKIVELRIDYADQATKPNISGEKKNLIENIKFRFNPKNKKIQVIGYELSYSKGGKGKYKKSFNFITGKYEASYHFNNEKKEASGSALELQNLYTENWNSDFLNKLLLYGNEIE